MRTPSRKISVSVAASFAIVASCFGLSPAAQAGVGDLKQKAAPDGCLQKAANPSCSVTHGTDGATNIVASPDGKNVYKSAGFPDQSITSFDRDASGRLVQKAGLAGCVSDAGSVDCVNGIELKGIRGFAISPDGRSVYGAGIDTGQPMAAFSRSTVDGTLTQKPAGQACFWDSAAVTCTSTRGMPRPTNVAVSPDNRFVFVSSSGGAGSNGIAVFLRNTTTTNLSQAGNTDACVRPAGADGCTVAAALPDLDDGVGSIAVSPDGLFLYAQIANAIQRFQINQTTGALTQALGAGACVSATGSSGACATDAKLFGLNQVTLSPDGKQLYAATSAISDGAVVVFDRNTATGVLSAKPGAQHCLSGAMAGCTPVPAITEDVYRVAVSPDGLTAYATLTFENRIVVFDRDLNGVLTPRPTPLGCNDLLNPICSLAVQLDGPNDVAVSADGKNVYVEAQGSDAVIVFDRELPAPPGGGGGGTADTTAPIITASAGKRQRLGKLKLSVTVNEAAKVSVTGTTKLGKRKSKAAAKVIKPKTASQTLAAGVKRSIKLKFTKKSAKKLKRAIKQRRRATLTLTVKATDAAGNSASKKLRVRLRR